MLLCGTEALSTVNSFRKFTELPASERKLLLRAFALVVATRALLWTVPFRLRADLDPHALPCPLRRRPSL